MKCGKPRGQTNKQWQRKITVPSGFTGRGLIRSTKQNHHSRHNTRLAHHSQHLNKAEFFFHNKNFFKDFGGSLDSLSLERLKNLPESSE